MAQLYPFTDPIAAEIDPPLRIVRGDGAMVFDSAGKSYFDAVSALWCAPLGFAPKRVTDAMTRQAETLAYYHSFMGRTPDIAETLAQRLAAQLPSGLDHILFGTSGSEAVETSVKIARYYHAARGLPEKHRIIARDGAYHGSGQMSAALTAMSYCHDGFGVPLSAVIRTGRPCHLHDAAPGETEIEFSKRRGRELDALIQREGAETIAAFIGEPVMGAGGVILPPDGYWAEVQNVLAKHDILLIADEIICGFGRTGRWFACETFGIEPDLMTLAKQLTASVFPMSAVAISGHVRKTVAELAHEYQTFGHGVTYGGHPVAAAVALECLDIYGEMDLPQHVSGLGGVIAKRLDDMSAMPGVLDTRCVGMLAAVEFHENCAFGPGLAARVGAEAERRGIFFRIIGDVLAIAPPYIATKAQLNWMMNVLADSILSVVNQVQPATSLSA